MNIYNSHLERLKLKAMQHEFWFLFSLISFSGFTTPCRVHSHPYPSQKADRHPHTYGRYPCGLQNADPRHKDPDCGHAAQREPAYDEAWWHAVLWQVVGKCSGGFKFVMYYSKNRKFQIALYFFMFAFWYTNVKNPSFFLHDFLKEFASNCKNKVLL